MLVVYCCFCLIFGGVDGVGWVSFIILMIAKFCAHLMQHKPFSLYILSLLVIGMSVRGISHI